MDSGNRLFRKPYQGQVPFIIFLVAVYAFWDFQKYLLLPPGGIHIIRQTDSLSFVWHYLHNGMKFFETGVLNLTSQEGKAACEFPVLYYLTAIIYQLIGEHESVLRLINLVIISSGFYSLFLSIRIITKSYYYSIVLTLMFLSSSVTAFYSINYLPDAPALGLVLTGWYFVVSFLYLDAKPGKLIVAYFFFTLSALLKVTSFISPVAAFLWLLIHYFSADFAKYRATWKMLQVYLMFIVSLLLVALWNVYAIRYNRIHNDHYFLTTWRPIWELNRHQIREVWDYVSNYWFPKYYYQSAWHFYLILVLGGLVFIRKSERQLLRVTLILLTGTILYFLMFYEQFKDHDYYFLTLIPGISFLVTHSFLTLHSRFPAIGQSLITKLIFLTICILSINFTREKLQQRFDQPDDPAVPAAFRKEDTRTYMESIGINREAKLILITDPTPNAGLYFLKRKGWNVIDMKEENVSRIRSYCREGAEYILLTDSTFLIDPRIVPFLGRQLGEKNGLRFYETYSFR